MKLPVSRMAFFVFDSNFDLSLVDTLQMILSLNANLLLLSYKISY